MNNLEIPKSFLTRVDLETPISGYDVNTLIMADSKEKIQPNLYSPSAKDDSLLIMKSSKKIKIPEKMTGKPKANCKLIFDTYLGREGKSTGAILSGLHGDGKTLTCELLATKMLEKKRPVFIINEYVSHTNLMKIASVSGACMFLFDEFDRYYSPAQQSELVGFFSDSGLSDVLIVVTTNNYGRLQTVLKNRPGRFLFHIRHNGMGMDMFELLTWGNEFTDEFKDDMEYYITSIKPSYDVLKVIADIAIMSDNDLEKFISILSDYNCPSWPGLSVESKSSYARINNRIRKSGKGIFVQLEGNYPDYLDELVKVTPPRKPGIVKVPNPFYKYMRENAPVNYNLAPNERPAAAKEAMNNVPKDLVLEFTVSDGYNHMTETRNNEGAGLPGGYIPQE